MDKMRTTISMTRAVTNENGQNENLHDLNKTRRGSQKKFIELSKILIMHSLPSLSFVIVNQFVEIQQQF